MTWFAQIYHDKFQRNMIALVFVLMGITLEYLQSFDAVRFFEIGDMLANTSGVALGLYLSLTSAKNGLLKIESYFG
jgi:glycopeptide antibiotics resistance protein